MMMMMMMMMMVLLVLYRIAASLVQQRLNEAAASTFGFDPIMMAMGMTSATMKVMMMHHHVCRAASLAATSSAGHRGTKSTRASTIRGSGNTMAMAATIGDASQLLPHTAATASSRCAKPSWRRGERKMGEQVVMVKA